MTAAIAEPPRALAQIASLLTGVSAEAILPRALARALAELPPEAREPLALMDRALGGDARICALLEQAASVPETYFFRHPDQFVRLYDHAAGSGSRKRVRAWSAGCATGEEAYSLAACLLAAVRGSDSVEVDVLGTDLVERHLEWARGGTYRPWSLRASGPEIFPAVVVDRGAVEVRADVRAVTRFQRHNLVHPPTEDGFDIVLCRNVLVYLTPEARSRALAHLVGALAPGGLLVLGPLDVDAPPRGTTLHGAPEQAIFRKVIESAPSPAPSVAPRSDPVSGVRARDDRRAEDSSKDHLEALACIERGELSRAARILGRLAHRNPTAVPVLLELAMVERRLGDHQGAQRRFETVLALMSAIGADVLIDGPQPLPASFYASVARTFLERGHQE